MKERKQKSKSNFLHSKIGLAQDYGISSLLLGCRSQLGHKFIYELLNFAKLGSRNGLLPVSNWIPSRLCTFADYSWVIIKDTLIVAFNTEMWPRQKAVILQSNFSNAFSSMKMFAFLSIFRRTLFPWVQCGRKKNYQKICCWQILDSLEQKLWNVRVICIHFSQCCIFRCSFGCHAKGFTIKPQGCWYAL